MWNHDRFSNEQSFMPLSVTDFQSQGPNPRVLVVDDEPINLEVIANYLEEAGLALSVATSGEEALGLTAELAPDLILLDILMPELDGYATCRRLKQARTSAETPVIFMSALSETVDKLKGFDAGGVDYVTKPLVKEEVLARVMAHLTIALQRQKLQEHNRDLKRLNAELQAEGDRRCQAEAALEVADRQLSSLSQKEAQRWGIDAFIGQSPRMLDLLDEIRRLQQAVRTNVVVLGESGTGKELVARAIHFGSARSTAPFVPVNCSAIPAELADAEFFGHLKGAFTGAAANRKGYFELAHGGALFLDEIGDMPLALQAKLLRILEDQRLTPVGGSQSKAVDVRVVAATNVAIQSRILDNAFRRDLYFRLAGYVLQLPPLRERKEDIPLLAEHFLDQLAQEMGRSKGRMTREALETLQNYHFPGNVRELRNLIEYALISSDGRPIAPRHLHFIADPTPQAPTPPSLAQPQAVRATEPPFPPPTRRARPGEHERMIVDYVRTAEQVTNSECQDLLGVTHHRASYLLKKLHKTGQLIREGERRWAYYRLP